MKMKRHQQDWNELATLDPLYAVCSDKGRRGNLWDPDQFFESGRREIDEVVTYLKARAPEVQFGSALDFGCGVGRLTAAMTSYWTNVVGLDIAEKMISLTKRYHANNTRCHFILNDDPELRIFQDNSFDFIYSNITLMHIPRKDEIKAYLGSFVRVLKPNGHMLFQLPTRVPFFRRIKLRRHLYHILEFFGASPGFLYHKMRLNPMKIMQVPKTDVMGWISPGARVLEVLGEAGTSTRYLAEKL